jgi:acetoin utilization deacetylase AcuC-like enzyme
MGKFFASLFGKKKPIRFDETELSEEDVMDRLIASVKECESEKRKEYDKIDIYKNRAKDLIFEIFKVHDSFWYEELKCYEEIKKHELNATIDALIVQKTDELIEEYRTRIQLCETKIDYCDRLSSDLKEQMNHLSELKMEAKKCSDEEKQKTVLEQHVAFIEREDESQRGTESVTVDPFDQLNETVRKINEDLRIKQKVKTYMENLEAELAKEDEKLNSVALKEMLEQLKKIV